jgi:hypothetical protein
MLREGSIGTLKFQFPLLQTFTIYVFIYYMLFRNLPFDAVSCQADDSFTKLMSIAFGCFSEMKRKLFGV